MTEKNLWLNKLQKLCSQKEICIADAYYKLRGSSLNEDEKEEIINILCKNGFIDEQRYVKAFVHDKLFINKWGRIKIKYFLKQKKINEQLINKVLSEISEDEYIRFFLSLAKAKLNSIKGKEEVIRKNKIFQYLMQKGVEMEIINKIWLRLVNS